MNFYVLNRISQDGCCGYRFEQFLGVYSSKEKAQAQMDHYKKLSPYTSDNKYFFELHQCQPDQVAEAKPEYYSGE